MPRQVSKYMDTRIESVTDEATLKDVIDKMVEKNVEFVWVKDTKSGELGGELCGIIGEEEIFDAVARGKDPEDITAGDIMEACRLTGMNPCLQIDEDATVEDAARLMSASGVHYALVTGATGVEGVFSVRGMVRALKD